LIAPKTNQKGLSLHEAITHPLTIVLSIRDVLRSWFAPLTPTTTCLFSLSVRTQFRCFVHYCWRAVSRHKQAYTQV